MCSCVQCQGSASHSTMSIAPNASATAQAREELLRRVLAPSETMGLLGPGHELLAVVSLMQSNRVEMLPPPPQKAVRQRRSRTRRATTEDHEAICAICCCNFTPGDRLRELPCGHVFHRRVTEKCGGVDLWLIKHDTCLVCRATH